MAARLVHVAVAVIRDDAGRVLVAQRLPHQHLAGLWEFPGGKLEPGETLAEGMRREIREELGVDVEALQPLMRVEHAYPEKTVLLDIWRVTRWQGEPHGAEGQPLRWVHPDDMQPADFPPADLSIIEALRLPPVYGISPDVDTVDDMARFVASVVAAGCRLVQVRLKAVPALAPALIGRLREQAPGIRILLNSDTQAALGTGDLHGADGLHLTSRAVMTMLERPAFPCAASCHDEAELARALALSLDFVTVSPVLATASHPEAAALGWSRFAALAALAGRPVYALGGLREGDLAQARDHGAVGIAGITLLG